MKKLVSVLIIALVATAVFAGFSAGLGFGYDKMLGNRPENRVIDYFGAKGISVSADLAYEFDFGLCIFDDFAFLPKTTKSDVALDYVGAEKYSGVKNYFGAGYVLPLEGDLKLMAGASFVVNSIKKSAGDHSSKNNSLGFALNLKAAYQFADHFSAFLAGNVDFDVIKTLVNSEEYKKTLKPAFGARIGVAYNF